jgi:hypothetical protein
MKRFYFLWILLFAFTGALPTSCSDDDDEPLSETIYGSIRDHNYTGNHALCYIDGERVTTVSEITMGSDPTDDYDESNPTFNSTLCVKGLLKKDKKVYLKVVSTFDNFSGETEFNGQHYNISGTFEGSPFNAEETIVTVYLTSDKQ